MADAAEEPPRWQEKSYCQLCQSSFTVKRRRHHCRACGQSACGPCSSRRVPLPRQRLAQPQRVCSDCYWRLTAPAEADAAWAASAAYATYCGLRERGTGPSRGLGADYWRGRWAGTYRRALFSHAVQLVGDLEAAGPAGDAGAADEGLAVRGELRAPATGQRVAVTGVARAGLALLRLEWGAGDDGAGAGVDAGLVVRLERFEGGGGPFLRNARGGAVGARSVALARLGDEADPARRELEDQLLPRLEPDAPAAPVFRAAGAENPGAAVARASSQGLATAAQLRAATPAQWDALALPPRVRAAAEAALEPGASLVSACRECSVCGAAPLVGPHYTVRAQPSARVCTRCVGDGRASAQSCVLFRPVRDYPALALGVLVEAGAHFVARALSSEAARGPPGADAAWLGTFLVEGGGAALLGRNGGASLEPADYARLADAFTDALRAEHERRVADGPGAAVPSAAATAGSLARAVFDALGGKPRGLGGAPSPGWLRGAAVGSVSQFVG